MSYSIDLQAYYAIYRVVASTSRNIYSVTVYKFLFTDASILKY